jgi:CheY-like chemotaxis protein
MMVDPETTVLIADDDVSFASFARTALAGIGATAQTVGDGDACLEAVRASLPDAILLDLFMPGIDGSRSCAASARTPRRRGCP